MVEGVVSHHDLLVSENVLAARGAPGPLARLGHSLGPGHRSLVVARPVDEPGSGK